MRTRRTAANNKEVKKKVLCFLKRLNVCSADFADGFQHYSDRVKQLSVQVFVLNILQFLNSQQLTATKIRFDYKRNKHLVTSLKCDIFWQFVCKKDFIRIKVKKVQAVKCTQSLKVLSWFP